MHAREKRNACNRFYPCVRCVFRVRALHMLQFFDLCRMTSVCCICCVAYGSLKTNL